MDPSRIRPDILDDILEGLSKEGFGPGHQDEPADVSALDNHTVDELFTAYCEYNGIIGYSADLTRALDDIRSYHLSKLMGAPVDCSYDAMKPNYSERHEPMGNAGTCEILQTTHSSHPRCLGSRPCTSLFQSHAHSWHESRLVMSATPIDINIVAKIQKLLEMASRSQGNEQEAAVAMDKAQELLAKYNLDLATIQDHKDKSKTEADGKRGYANISRSAMYEWQRELVGTIAECNFCIAWITQEREAYNKRYSWGMEVAYRKVKRYKILGREGNTMVVLMMVDYLFETIERLLPYPNKERLSRSAISWRKGVSDRLQHRIIDKYQEMRKADYAKQTDTQYTTALAIVSVDRSEEIANYEFRFGAGSWAEKEARSVKYVLEQKERDTALALKLANETPEEREAREAQEAEQARLDAKDWEKTQARWQREAERKRDATDWSAYAKGEEAGSMISLSSQLKNTTNKGVL